MMEKETSDVHDVININNMTLSDSPGEPGDLNGAHSSWEDPETETDGFGDLAALPVEECERRPTCLRCRRPQKVCLCPFLPVHPLDVSTCLYIVQHPAEESRVLRTVPLLAACLPPGKCKVLVGRRFSEERHPELAAVCRDSRTLILYPGPGAQNLEELHEHTGPEELLHEHTGPEELLHEHTGPEELLHEHTGPEENLEEVVHHHTGPEDNLKEVVHEHTGPEELLHEHRGPEDNLEEVVHDHKVPDEPEAPSSTHYNIIIIDGTWSQAKDMFLRNTLLHLPKQVQLSAAVCSQYVIRTQPTNMCLSTLECAAVCLSILEHNQNIQEVLLKPLRALCSFQLQHGAQVHHSKEHLLKNGLYDKPMPKNKRKIKRMEKLVTENVCPR